MNLKSLLIFCLGIFSVTTILAQDTLVVQDLETWLGIELEKKLKDNKLRLSLKEEFRFNSNSSELKEFYTEADIGYEFFNDWKLGAGYRFTKQNKNESYMQNHHRFHVDLNYNYSLKRLSLDSRIRFQSGNESWFDKSPSDYTTNKFRLKLNGSYNIKNLKLDPYFSPELFIISKTDHLRYLDEDYPEENHQRGFEKIRLTAGTNYKFKKAGRMKVFFRYEQEFPKFANDYMVPERFYIFGISYKFSF